VFAFGSVVSSNETYRRYAASSIEAVREPGDVVVVKRGQECIFRAYNDILDEVSGKDDLEAVVLMHQDVEIHDPEFHSKVRKRFSDPRVAILGPIGGIGITSMSWWRCERPVGSIYWNMFPGLSLEDVFDTRGEVLGPGGDAEPVDSLDGLLMVLSPWAARELLFDEALGPAFHGYDADICFQARQRGRLVYAEPLAVSHHNDARPSDPEGFRRAYVSFAEKWGF
jgi:GT2 family glycosyltransferase